MCIISYSGVYCLIFSVVRSDSICVYCLFECERNSLQICLRDEFGPNQYERNISYNAVILKVYTPDPVSYLTCFCELFPT